MQDWPRIAERLRAAGIECGEQPAPRRLSGGNASGTWRLDTSTLAVFLKSAPPAALDRLSGERDALLALRDAAAVRVPRPLACVATEAQAVLAIEWLDLSAPDALANRALGTQLAKLHRHTAKRFGWHRDNTIGATPQTNTPDEDWLRFFRRERLAPQFALAATHGFGDALAADAEWLDRHLDSLFTDYRPVPSLTHGDLWGGNWGVASGHPVIFDPAPSYADRETDLAMTRLFGGFNAEFYRAYESLWPLAPGAEARRPLYQLYHVLNHLNLFGSTYLTHAERLLSELRKACDSI